MIVIVNTGIMLMYLCWLWLQQEIFVLLENISFPLISCSAGPEYNMDEVLDYKSFVFQVNLQKTIMCNTSLINRWLTHFREYVAMDTVSIIAL